MDLSLALIAIIILSPVLLMVSLLVRVKLGRPVLFKQYRPGLNERIFIMYKFRTMTNERDECGELLPNELRHTKLGKFLRDTSLDELPGLFNIVKGDMSIIGPRPLLVEYLPLYNAHQQRRHEVRPGLSGLAQVNGRNTITWEEKFDFDVQYVDNISLVLDFKLIIKTILKVFKREGINKNDSITMDKFRGTTSDEKEKALFIKGHLNE